MRLPQPTACSLALVDSVVEERQNGINATFFRNIRIEWRDRIQEYIDNGGSPEFIQTWAAINHKKKSFLNLYLQPQDTSTQKAIIDDLRNHGLNLCPACGEAGAPNTLDHYLPKAEYPHFCITPLNLFPMCDSCQKEKGEKTGDTTAPRFFIHPYFDVFIAEQAIELSINPPFLTPTFDLTPHSQLTANQSALVECHIRELAIARRYGHFFREQHRRLIRLTVHMRNTGQDVPTTLETFCTGAEVPTKNSWEHVFYSAVLANEDMMDYLVNGTLPAFP